MVALDTREQTRDSLYLKAWLRLATGEVEHAVKVRNLSAEGMMVESGLPLGDRQQVDVKLRGIGWVSGRVVWTQGRRAGLELDEPVDPQVAREPVNDDGNSRRWIEERRRERQALRKI